MSAASIGKPPSYGDEPLASEPYAEAPLALTILTTETPGLSSFGIASAFVVGSAALVILALQPVLLGAFVDLKVLTTSQLGWTATLESLTLGAFSALSPKVRGGRVKVLAAATLLCVFDWLSASANAFATLAALRALAGASEGLMMG